MLAKAGRETHKPRLYRIAFPGPGDISVMPRPHAPTLARTLRRLRRQGVTTIVSALMDYEERRYHLTEEWRACKELELDFFALPIDEFGVPDNDEDAHELLATLRDRLAAGEHIAFHCRLALGRSPMLASALMIDTGIPVEDAVWAVSTARGRPVPTRASQRAWLHRLAAARTTS
jgi:protein-tyrosine phosphatase